MKIVKKWMWSPFLAMALWGGALTHMSAQDVPAASDVLREKPNADVKVPQFAVVSVRENKGDNTATRIAYTATGYETQNIPLRTIIAAAYGVRPDHVVGGPGWLDSIGYDIKAKIDDADFLTFRSLSAAQKREMLRPLLAERFHLQVKTETRTEMIYDLVEAKTGAKLVDKRNAPLPAPEEVTDVRAERRRGTTSLGSDSFSGVEIGMPIFARSLATVVHTTVEDHTGLLGLYDIDLKWESQNLGDFTNDQSADPINEALQRQLGLRLVRAKGEVLVIYVEQATKPASN